MRRFVLALALALLALPSGTAAADGPSYVMSGWTGVTAPGLAFRYVTLPGGSETVLATIRRSSGRVWSWRSLKGRWGVPMVATDGTAGGLSRDRRVLVLGDWSPQLAVPRRSSHFLLVNTSSLRVWRTITLPGDFTFDALSPGGGTLYLIQHLAGGQGGTRYRVRAYDIAARRLLQRVIADRRQSSWTMDGSPVTRATSADGRWVYTLYRQPGGYPFVHALDAVARTAVCIGLPWKGDQDVLYSTRLGLEHEGRTLTLSTRRGRPLFAIDTRTYWVSRPRPHKGGLFAAIARLL